MDRDVGLPLAAVPAGAVLAHDLVDSGGTLVLAQGTQLTAAILARLEKVGIERVVLEADSTADDAMRRRLLIQADRRFAPHAEDPYMMAMRDVVIRHVRERPPRTVELSAGVA